MRAIKDCIELRSLFRFSRFNARSTAPSGPDIHHGDSLSSEYIPFYTGAQGYSEVFTDPEDHELAISYRLNIPNVTMIVNHRDTDGIRPLGVERKFENILEFLDRGGQNVVHLTTNKLYQVHCGIITKLAVFNTELLEEGVTMHDFNPKVFMCLGIRSDYVFELMKDVTKVDYSKFCLFVDPEFLTPVHKLLYGKVYAEYIELLIEGGVDVVISKKIPQKCFGNSLQLPKFKNVRELQQFTKTLNTLIV